MSGYEPGPIDLGDLPLSPPIVHDGTFAALLEPVVNVLGASDDVLGAQQRDIATNTAEGLDATFAATIGQAEIVAADQPNVDADQTAAALHDAGDGVDGYRGSVLPYLPQPDAPVESGFRDFPQPDFGAPNQDPGAIPPPPGI